MVKDALNQGYLNTGEPYTVEGFASHADANEARLSIKRAATHLGMSAAPWVTDDSGNHCWRDGKPACGGARTPHRVSFKLWGKDSARKHVVDSTGGDPAKLKYNAFRRREGRLIDDSGTRIA